MPVKIFLCYAHEDENLLNKLKTHLRSLERAELITIWHDRNISAGSEWEREIDKHITEAQVILLLISPDFLASDYCYSIEMTKAIERHERGVARVIPVILRPVYWQIAPLRKLQALPKDGKPIVSSEWHHPDEAFLEVVEGIRRAIGTLKEKPRSLSKARPNRLARPSSPANNSIQNTGYFTSETTQARQVEIENQQTQISQQINPDNTSVDQAYEALRKRSEKNVAGSTYCGAVIVRASDKLLGSIVYIQPSDNYERGSDLHTEYASIKLHTINQLSIAAAIFKEVLQGPYVVWTEHTKPIFITVCQGDVALIDLQRVKKSFDLFRNGHSITRRGSFLSAFLEKLIVSLMICGICTFLGYFIGLQFHSVVVGPSIGFVLGLALVLWGISMRR